MKNLNKKVISLAAATTVILGGATAFVVPTMASAATGAVTAATDGDDTTEVAAAITAALSGLVNDGTITQAQADAVARTLAENPPVRPGGHGGHGFGRGGGPMAAGLVAAATTLGMTPQEIRTALEGGASLASLAEGKGIAKADLVTAMVDAVVAEINAHEAEEGEDPLTQVEIERITEFATAAVDRVGLPDRPGHERGGIGGDRGRGGHGFGLGGHHAGSAQPSSTGRATTAAKAAKKAKAAKEAKAADKAAVGQAERAARTTG